VVVDVETFYTRPSSVTDLTDRAALADCLPGDVDALVRVVQGLLIYDVVAQDFYGVDIPAARANEIHIRRMTDLIGHLLAIDDRPLERGRPADRRLFARCRHYAVLLTALLRHCGVPARARCGFADYFHAGYYEDHWVCEYWHGARRRWVLVDAQLDEVWREKVGIDFDVLDVPRDRFVVAGEAWSMCRAGAADPDKFGIEFADLRGLWFIAGDLIRDIAALNKEEMLPWDVWGGQPNPNEALDQEQLRFYDWLADLSRAPDIHLAEVLETCRRDDRVRVPGMVMNVLVGEMQPAS
jgi:Transglutaminase-like superfamily